MQASHSFPASPASGGFPTPPGGHQSVGVRDTDPRGASLPDAPMGDARIGGTAPRGASLHDASMRDARMGETPPRGASLHDTSMRDTGPRDTGRHAHPPAGQHAPRGPNAGLLAGAGPEVRGSSEFTRRISRDGSTGFLAEPARYHLYASLACPWSQRALIVRRLLGLERVIGLTLTDPVPAEHGWRFAAETGGRDPLTGARFLSELYLATDPGYTGRVSLPVLWDTRTQRIVTNDFAQLTVQLETEFGAYCRPGAPDLYPAAQRREIEAVATLVHHTVNNGVYKAGLAASQADYEVAFDAIFTTLDALEERLARRRFLLGPQPTEADVRLFPTLARFDAVYYLLYKCNLHRLADYPSMWAYARDLYQQPGFGDTTDFVQIKLHYYQAHSWINPTRIVPKGPYVSWLEPHGRERMPG